MKNLYLLIAATVVFMLTACGNGKDKKKVESPEDMAHARVSVLMGSTHDKWLSEKYPNADIFRIDMLTDILTALEKGKVDAAMVDEISYKIGHAGSGKYHVVGSNFSESLGIVFNLKNTELRDQFNEFLATIRENGTYDVLYSKWFDNYHNAQMPVWDDIPTGKPLKVGFTGTSEGFAFMRNGKLSGFDVELIELFGRSIGRPIEVSCVNLGGLIASIASGMSDIIASGITITEERKKQMLFSDPYCYSQALTVTMADYGTEKENKPRNSKSYASMKDVSDARIGVLMSSIQDIYITDHFPQAEPVRLDMTSDLIMALKTQQVDAVVLPGPEIPQILRQNSDIAILDGDIYQGKLGIGFRDVAMRDRFNTFLADIRTSSVYEEMINRWITDDELAEMPDLPFVKGKKPIIVGTTGQSPAFSFLKNGVNCGLDVELTARFAISEGRPVKYEIMNFGALIPALMTGRIDIIANSVMITPERSKEVAFSEPYYATASTVIVLKKNLAVSAKINDGSDLPTANVGAMTGTMGEMHIEQNYPQAKRFSFDDINDAIAALRAHKIDYVITAYTTALIASHKNADLMLLPKKYIEEPAAIAMSKNNPELLTEINAILDRFQSDGTLDKVISNWIKESATDYTVADVPKVTSGQPIRVAVAANREPMCFVWNNRIMGLDIELIERIAYELGRPVEYMDMKFTALITALESGRADVVISNYTVTKERAQKVNFSKPYFTNPQILLTNKAPEEVSGITESSLFAKIKDSFYSNLILENRWQLIQKGLWATLVITFFAIILGTIVGGGICAMRMSANKALQGFAKAYITVMRGTPILVLLMIFFYVVFASTNMSAIAVAVITFALNMAAYSSEMFRTSIESIDPGQKEAGIAMGFSKYQTFIYVIFPQAVRKIIPVYKGEAISLLKMTSIVGYIAVVDLTKASDIIRSRTFDAFFPLIVVAIIYFILSWLLGLCLDYINRKVSKT